MRNGNVSVRDRLRRRCSMTQTDAPMNRSDEEAPIIKKEAFATVPMQCSSRASRQSEVTRDLDRFSQRQHFATDDDGNVSDDEKHLAKRKKYYIVADGEIPTELYRTDLLHRVKQEEDTDASSDDEAALVRLSDRWREEWNHGVQIPLFKNLPNFVVRDAPCFSSTILRQRSRVCSKTDGLLISTHSRRYVREKHKHVVMPKLRHYHGDRADRLYLSKLNEKRTEVGLPQISEENFGNVMDRLEVSCHQAIHSDLLSPLTSPVPSADAEYDENACCDICRQPDYEEDDNIIFCDGCNLSVHQSCYGLDSVPPDEWLCQKCMILGFSAVPHCALCPLTGGAMKCTRDGDTWAHVACALWIHEVRFTDIVHREPISNICDIPYERWMLRCTVCDTKQGACIQCSVESCTNAFHVCCALRSGQVMRIEHEGNDDDDDGVRMVSLCRQHSKKMYPSPLRFNSMGITQTAVLTLQEMERLFFLYVTVEDVASALSLSEDIVSDIYEYWKLRRIDNFYKPLMNDRSEVERQTAFRLKSSPAALFPVKLRSEATMRQNLERVRNLCYMVERREKTKLAAVQCWIETYRCVYRTLMEKNVPYSNRTLERFLHAVSSMILLPSESVSADAAASAERSSVPSSSRPYLLPRSTSPPRKANRIRERNGPAHHLRKYAIQGVPLPAEKSVKSPEEPFSSGHYSLRALV